jgi:Restriction Enzyme Adenine Methylase Associated
LPGTTASHAARSAYLLAGRRVTVADLIEGGLLAPGSRLRFDRVPFGKIHHAVVTPDGHIALDDGQTFSSPSRAAVVAAGVRASDGWRDWAVEQARLQCAPFEACAASAVTYDVRVL